ncbi:MAG TPA: isoprenylcysteine carboxylmethyltransferase family protein [Methylomirabilota bacterium]|nr:isoprenylcysteine carboxylmethyltransferase family protein [Methylomirabilota bacterium]
MYRRTLADVLLFGVTAVELALLAWLTPTFGVPDWIYLAQHLVVLGVALTRRAPQAQDRSMPSNAAVLVAYAYPYAQMLYLRWAPDEPVWPDGGLGLVIIAACLSLASLLALGRRFGIRPALRELAQSGPYRFLRHPMYLAYVLADVGYNLVGWNEGTVLLVLAGWAALVYRIRAEERVLAGDPGWAAYAARVRYRLIPGLW